MKSRTCFLHELSMLAKIPRSGFAFLGTGKQSVAEHSFGMTMVAWVLADLVDKPVDKQRLLVLCLFHDLLEARTGDMNYVQKKYVKVDEKRAIKDLKEEYGNLGDEVASYLEEYQEGKSVEALIAHDADQLELMLILRQQQDIGNPQAKKWMDITVKRLKTDEAKRLVKEIMSTPSDEWWLKNKDDPHWIKPKQGELD